jgi:hypothetical protein
MKNMEKMVNMEELETLERPLEESLEEPEEVVKVKKPRTQKQIDAFAKTNLIRQQNANLRKTAKESLDEQKKSVLDKKIVAKAIALKKKQIKEEKMLLIDEEKEEEIIPVKKVPLKRQASVKKVVKVKEPEPESDSETDTDSDDDIQNRNNSYSNDRVPSHYKFV